MDAPISGRPPIFKQHWLFPVLLASLLLLLLILLPWRSQRMEFENHQQQLIESTLWVEQGIRFQLMRNEESLLTLGEAILTKSLSTEKIGERLTKLAYVHPEFNQLLYLNDEDRPLFHMHPTALHHISLYSKETIEDARKRRAPQYSEPYMQDGNTQAFLMDYVVPLFKNGRYIGSMVATYHLSAILKRMVPWWFAKDHQVTLIDPNNRVLANRADSGVGRNVYLSIRNLDLPGVHLILKTNSFKDAPKLLSNYLVVAVVFLGLGLLWSLWALWSDVARRQSAEIALRKQIAFRRAMEKSVVTGLRVRSLDGRLVYVNPAFCEMVGYSEEQLLGQKIPMPFWSEETIENFQKRAEVSQIGTHLNGLETVYVHATGRRIPVLIYESPLVDDEGIQTGWMASIVDMSELKQAEQVLRQHEEKLQSSVRLSTMGELASVMAHELNQPLAAISSYATGALNLMKAHALDMETLEPALIQMQNQAQRAGQIIRSVHDFVTKREPHRTRQQFKEVFEHILPLIELQAKSYLIALQVYIEDNLPIIFVDAISLEQVMLNLTRNALQSMQELTVKQRVLQIEAKRRDKFIQVDVIDHGPGLTPQVIEKLFSPFFSTKSEGVGMGLNICRTIIEFHGGQLTYRTNPSGGTIFSFTLPILDVKVDVSQT